MDFGLGRPVILGGWLEGTKWVAFHAVKIPFIMVVQVDIEQALAMHLSYAQTYVN